MKRNLITHSLLLFLFCLLSSSLYSQSWDWVTAAACSQSSGMHNTLATDLGGNSYFATTFSATCVLQGDTLVSNSAWPDGLLMKLDPLGQVQWKHHLKGTEQVTLEDITLDQFGHVYVTGSFWDSLFIGSDTLVAQNVVSNIFIARLDTTGAIQWIQTAWSTYNDELHALATDSQGNLSLFGDYRGAFHLDTLTLTATGQQGNIFLIQLDPAGNVRWSMQDGTGQSGTYIHSGDLDIDQWDNHWLTGNHFGPITLGGTQHIHYGDLDGYVAMYSPTGAYRWSTVFGGPHTTSFGINVGEYSNAIDTDTMGNAYIGGSFYISAAFGSFFRSATNPIGNSLFVAKVDSMGNFVWVTTGNAPLSSDGVNDLVCSPDGEIWVSGTYTTLSILGNDTLNLPGQAIFAAHLNPFGTFTTALDAGGSNSNLGRGIGRDRWGNAYVSGMYSDSSQFGSIVPPYGNLNQSPFVAKIGVSCQPWTPILNPDGPVSFCEGDSVQIYAPPGFYFTWQDGSVVNPLTVYNSTTVQATLVDLAGCEFPSSIITVSAFPSPAPQLTATPGSISTGLYNSYQWYLDGNLLVGETQSTLLTSQSGCYQVEVIDSNGCMGVSDTLCLEIVSREPAQISGLQVFPNPANSFIKVVLDIGNGNLLNWNWSLISPRGRTVAKGNQHAVEAVLDLSQQSAGMYLLKVNVNDQIWVHRIQIE